MELEELFSGLDRYGLDPATYQYFHQLLERRTILLNCDVNEDIVERVYLPLKEFEEDDSQEPVTLILNSCGGSVTDGFFLAEYISKYSKPLNIVVPGYACSMAAVILAGGGHNPNVTRSCYSCSYALLHDGYVALAASESKTAADIMCFNDKIEERIENFITNHTNITKEEFESHARHQWFLFSDEMLEKGLIDHVIGGENK